MHIRTWRFVSVLLALGGLAACGGGSSTSSDAQITIQARFEKVALGPAGFGGTTTLPARYCYAEVCDSATGAVLAADYLGSAGTGTTFVPRGSQVYVNVYARYQVPSADPNSFFLRGSVKNAPLSVIKPSIGSAAFANIPDWYVTSNTFTANQDGTLTVTALASNRIAGAFNIADQAVTFAAAVRDMDGTGTLRLPNLHTFWTTSTTPADQDRTYPEVTWASATSILTSSSGRALFSHQVYGLGTGAANTETDEWDDGVLQETFARLLFADYSYKPDGSSALSLLRRDNDNAYVSRYTPSESTVAFVSGFSDFLSGVVRNTPQILDSYVDGSGIAQVDDFDLSSHAMVASANKGEFTRGSIAVSLWGIWKNDLGGGQAGLHTLWQAATSGNAVANGTGEYEQATLGCYPSYLLGVANRVSAGTWNAILGELALEAVPDPSPTYFNTNALWLTVGVPYSASGALQTYDASQARYYDRNQSQAYRFTHGGGARTITMTPSGGQDFFVELLGPGGLWAGSTDQSLAGQPRTLSLSNLPAGVYAVRVRAGYTSATGTYGYTIKIN
jgi:hypothetical protein